MTRQIITSPNGDRLVVMPEAEYDALVDALEDSQDRAAIDLHDAAAARGEIDLVPAAVVERLLSGEHSKVRIWREHRGLTAAALARATGLSAPYISQIESAKRQPGVEALKQLAASLNVDIDDLI
jgi:DNA-binding XRE family transcriptional regulator